jgi:beta-barrel assembly-enhancing protease
MKNTFLIAMLISFYLNSKGLDAQTNSKELFTISNSTLPSIFSLNVKGEAAALAKKQDVIDEKIAFKMYEESNFHLLDLINSGQVYVNDELTNFLEAVLAEMLVSMPELKDEIRIIATKDKESNAYCMANGVVVVNVGLISKLNNVSQLAAVLAHEISHFKKQHALKKKKNGKEIRDNEAISSKVGTYKMLQFSREFEFEADASGLQYLARTPFDAREASEALKLISSSKNNDTLTTDLSDLLNSSVFTVDTSIFNEKSMRSELKKSIKKNKSIIADNEDSGNTHPDIEKRALALNEILASMDYVPVSPKLAKEYEIIHYKSLFENAINSYNESDYLISLHRSLLLLEHEPENLLANEMVVKNLYWLCRFKENGVLVNYFEKVNIEGNKSIAKLKLLFSKTKSTELGKMLYTFSKKQYEKFDSNQDLLFYLGAAAEMHLGKDAAEIHYRNYFTKFPDGRYSTYVANKIQ